MAAKDRAPKNRIGEGAPDMQGGEMNSEHESDAARTPAPEANRTEKDGAGPTGKDEDDEE